MNSYEPSSSIKCWEIFSRYSTGSFSRRIPLYVVCLFVGYSNTIITGTLLREKALLIATRLGIENFKASDG
jgi:hypothetical protein